MLAASCLQATVRMVERAAGGPDGIAAAVAAGVLELDHERLRFTHPLLGSVAYESSPPWARRDAHARLAAVLDPSLERAHHLARGTAEADEAVAHEIRSAAQDARERGATELAAQLADEAVRLTPADSPEAFARALAAAEDHATAGDPFGARTRLEALIESLPPGVQRANAMLHAANLHEHERSRELGLLALEDAGDDAGLRSKIHLMLSLTYWNAGEIEACFEHGRAAVRLAESTGDSILLAISLGDLVESETLMGLPFADETAERLLDLERQQEIGASSYLRPSLKLANIYLITDRLGEARRLLESELRRVEAIGDEAIRWGLLARLSDVELRAGNLSLALQHGKAAVDSRLFGDDHPHPFAVVPHARALAQLGDHDAARAAARETLPVAEQIGQRIVAMRARGILGLIALVEGEPREALEELRPVIDELRTMRFGELSVFGVWENAIEAAVAIGELDEAESLAAWVDEMGRPANRSWHRAIAARGRAMVASARGSAELARAHLAEALQEHDALPQPFELGRTLLVQGRIERRAKNRRASREAFAKALELFDEMGAARFAELAAAELARIPGRPPATGKLTETERRVAEHAAAGLSNKEIAAKLFITVRTVESNLTKAYTKLGIRARAQLARVLPVPGPDDVAVDPVDDRGGR